MAVEVNPLKPHSNELVLDAIRNEMTPAYQARIPEATRAGVKETARTLLNYRPHYNEFIDAMVNRIGSVQVRNTSWSNPLAMFKKGLLEFGDTVEEVKVGLIEGKTYDADREHLERDIFGTHTTPVQANFHKVNRQNYYPITINEPLLHRAFLEAGGLTSFISQMLQAPTTSDQWDEFLLMCSLFPEYEANGGFYHVQVPDVERIESDSADAKRVLTQMRAMAGNLTFLSSRYNAAHMPAAASRDSLVIFATPEFVAKIDVEALAGAFNMERMQMHGRIIEIPKENFGIDGAQALMTTDEFFQVYDQRLENTSAPNPVGLQTNYFLHHWQVISASRFVPSVLFNTEVSDEAVYEIQPVTGVSTITVQNRDGDTVTTLERGELYQAVAEATGAGDNVDKSVIWYVEDTNDTRTHISETGVLSVGPSEGDSFTVKVETAWTDPAVGNVRSSFTTSKSYSVTGEALPDWPDDHGHFPDEPTP